MTIEKFIAYGWVVIKIRRLAGEKFGVLIVNDSTRENVGATTLYVKGQITAENLSGGSHIPVPRTPGVFNRLLGDIPAGRYRFTVIEESESYCVDKKLNNGLQPNLDFHILENGENISGNLLICSGPDSSTITDNYTATEQCYVLKFNEVYNET